MTDDRIDRIDRAVLRALGILVLLLGIGVLLHSTGALGTRRQDSPVVSSPTASWYDAHAAWLWPSVGVALLLVAALALWWVSSQVRMQGSSRVELERAEAGNLTVSGGSLAECVERDAVNQDGIERARARVSTTPDAVHVWLTVWVGAPYDVGRAIARVTNTVLPNLAATLDGQHARPLRTHITVETAESTISRLD